MKCLKPTTAMLLALLLPALSRGQSYTVSWFTIEGGGGTSSGATPWGAFTVSGTIGQPDAGTMSGATPWGAFRVTGGFWSLASVVQASNAPPLSILQTNGAVIIYWPQPALGFVLDESSALTSPPPSISWMQVPYPYQTNGTHIFISVPMPSGQRFYRLRSP